MLLLDALTDRPHLGLRLLHSGARPQPADDVDPVHEAEGPLVLVGAHGDPELGGAARRELEVLRQNTEHGVGSAAYGNRLVDDVGVAAEEPLPDAIAEDDDAAAVGVVFALAEAAAVERLDPQHVEEIGADAGRLYALRLFAPGEAQAAAAGVGRQLD